MHLLYTLHDQDWARTKSLGIAKTSLAILPGLAAHPAVTAVDVLANASLAHLLPRDLPQTKFHLIERPAPRGGARVWWDQFALARWVARLQPDWLLLPKGFSPLLSRPAARVSAFVHDDVFQHYAEQGRSPFSGIETTYFRTSLRRTLATADVVVTPSQFVATDLARRYRCRAAPVAIGEPLLGAPNPIPSDVPAQHLLLLLSPFPHKLTGQAVQWLQRFLAEHPTVDFRVTGIGALPAGVSWPEDSRWRRHARLDEAEFRRVRGQCGALAYFSAYEGFGLPPLEAVRDGQRVVASDIPALRERLPTSLLFRNDRYESFRTALARALTEPPTPVIPDDATTVAARWMAALSTIPGQPAQR